MDHWLKKHLHHWLKKTFGSLAEKHLDHRLKKTFGSSAEKNICIIGWKKHSAPQWPEITSALVVLFATFLCWLLCFIRITQLEKKNNTVCAIFKEIFWAHICANILGTYLCKYFEQIFWANICAKFLRNIKPLCTDNIYFSQTHNWIYKKRQRNKPTKNKTFF